MVRDLVDIDTFEKSGVIITETRRRNREIYYLILVQPGY